MILNALRTFYRVTVRHPRYAVLNLLGLSFGIAVFVTLCLYARFETSFESWLPDADKIYKVGTRFTQPGRPETVADSTMGGMLELLHEDYPDLVGTRTWELQASVHLGSDVIREREQLVDSDFFKLFDLDLVAGDKQGALAPGKIMLTADMARKYFGHVDAVGETLRLSDDEGGGAYVVSAILKNLPRNTDRNFDFVRLLTPQSHASGDNSEFWKHWGAYGVDTYVRFETPAEADRLQAGLDDFVDRKGAGARAGIAKMHTIETLRLLKMREVHLRSAESKTAVVTLGLVGVLSFFIAAINFINLSTARAGMRAREVAVRRTLGATRTDLRVQFLFEAVLMTLAASIVGIILVALCLPAVNAAGGLSLSLDFGGQGAFLALLLGGVLLLGLVSGIYPAFVLSGFQPAQVLASSRSPSGGRFGMRLREALVVMQFAVVVAFFIMTLGFERQLEHMKVADLGFQRDGLLIVPSTYDPAMTPQLTRAVHDAFRGVPGVTGIGTADSAPGDENSVAGANMTLPWGAGGMVNLTRVVTGPGFFPIFGARLLAGRFLDENHADESPYPSEKNTAAANIVINVKAVRALGLTTPEQALGKTIYHGTQPLTIVGVIDALRFHTPKGETEATTYYFQRELAQDEIVAVRYNGVSESAMRQALTAAWRSVAPDVPLELVSAVDNLDKYTKPDRNRSRLFGIGAAVAALVGCIGLYGMAAFSTSRRMLEVAVRKVLGATRGGIVRLLVGQFLRPVLLANLVAVPIGYILLQGWLAQFSDPIAITAGPFLIASGVAIAVAVITVAALAFQSANAEPSRALRNE